MHSEMMKGFGGVDETTHGSVREVVAVAQELGISPAQVALAWLRYRPVPVIPISARANSRRSRIISAA